MGAHDRLHVYPRAIHAADLCEAVARRIGAVRPDLTDQLRRAACSVPFNIAEGAAEYARREKTRFYRIARRSAAEAESILEVIGRHVLDEAATTEARAAVREVFALLVRLAQAIEAE